MTAPSLAALASELDAVPGTVSVWYGPVGGPPAYARHADATHYAASTMKVAVLAALYRAAEAGTLDLDAEVAVRNEFCSAADGAPSFGCSPEEDSDDQVWQKIGGTASLRWLAHRMIVVSGNLATNICLTAVGPEAVARVWRAVGARHSVVGRCIEDSAARECGITNQVTAADLAALMSAIVRSDPELAGPRACAEMLDILLAQERGEDLASGLPPGTRIAHKNGWITGVRHGAAVVFPDDADPYCLVCCTTTPLAGDEAGIGRQRAQRSGARDQAAGNEGSQDAACHLLARVAAASWADRHTL